MNITLHDFSRHFGKQVIFKALDFSFSGQGIHGIMGANGSGKTTLMRAIAGLDRLYSGQISIKDGQGNPLGQRECTYVSPYPYMIQGTVFENIIYPLRLRQWTEEKASIRADELIAVFGIEDLRHKKAAHLSAGETQKVALARALSFKPKVLLLDEPTSNIDTESTQVIERALMSYQIVEDGLILAITHDLEQAKRMCQAVYVLKDGQLSRNE